jgi:non-lysosomal glucosylceramidase
MQPGHYEGAALRHIAMPLGGIGTGQVAICGDGSLRQWQLLGRPNHTAFVPDSLFAIRCTRHVRPFDAIRLLQGTSALIPGEHTPSVTDDYVPDQQRRLLASVGGFEQTVFGATYPVAQVTYSDPGLPVEVELKAWNPFVPLDQEASSLPVALFDFTVRNVGAESVGGCLAASLQNFIGWDGFGELRSSANGLYGGNVNRLRFDGLGCWIAMDNPSLADDDPSAGQLVLATPSVEAAPYERWTEIDELFGFMAGTWFTESRKWHSTEEYVHARRRTTAIRVGQGASPAGRTWNGALAVPYALEPGGSASISFVLAWHFPNRIVDWDQGGPLQNYGRSVFWLGNAYTKRFLDAESVVRYVDEHRAELAESTATWTRGFAHSTLEPWLAEAMAAQGVVPRSPTCFVSADGRFYGFEGGLGASTHEWGGDRGGSCPLNCSHVWNYEQAVANLFPALERTMRDTELQHTQAPDGHIPHRVLLPLYLPQLLNGWIGGPDKPALDGMLGCLLKLYREMRAGADRKWLVGLWPRAVALVDYIRRTWDTGEDGILRGEQPNTFDIAFFGANTYIGGLWIAALLAFSQLAEIVGDAEALELAWKARARAERASAAYDALLWNGEYYEQEVTADLTHQYGSGCLTDQLNGQWWAHQLDLGYILPADHVRTALESIVRYNLLHRLGALEHRQRVYADADDSGTVLCSWPRGGRPEAPMLYCDEVWSGVEYTLGYLLIEEGMIDAGLEVVAAIRRRHDGTRRNPYNEIECGDHYVRSLSGWSVVEALGGWRYNGIARELLIDVSIGRPRRGPLVAGDGWGELDVDAIGRARVSCHHGAIALDGVAVMGAAPDRSVQAAVDGKAIVSQSGVSERGRLVAQFCDRPIRLDAGSVLSLACN